MDLLFAERRHVVLSCPKEREDTHVTEAGLFTNLANYGIVQGFTRLDGAGWHLNPSTGAVGVAEHEESISLRNVADDLVHRDLRHVAFPNCRA